MNPTISIIVPVYNVERYLTKCLLSIINQTFKDIEIILIDDGSTDESGKICDDFAKKDRRIRVIHKENGGLSSARNKGLDLANGEYIGFVDSDDLISTNMYEILLKYLKLYNTDIAIGGFTNNKSNLFNGKEIKNKNILYVKDNVLLYYLKNDGHSVWRRLYKRELFKNVRFELGEINEDVLASYEVMKKCKSVVVIKENLYFWNLEPTSISRSPLSCLKNQSSRIVKIIESESNNKELIIAARLREIQFDYRNITKSLRFGFKNELIEKEFKDKISNYKENIKKNYFNIIKSKQFRIIDKIQLFIICFSYNLYKKIYLLIK